LKPETSGLSLQPSAFSSKPWWQSRTLIGIAVILLSQVLRYLKIDIVDAEVTDMLNLALDTVGAGLAIYGRIDARKALKLTMPGGAFNPRAEVRRAIPATRNRKGWGQRGRAAINALGFVVILFAMLGLASGRPSATPTATRNSK